MNSMDQASTIDPKEVDYYERFSATWWDKEGPFWPLHVLNDLRMEWIVDQLSTHLDESASNVTPSQPLSGLRVLDIGCGGGLLSEALAKAGAKVTGLDVVEKNINVAKHHAKNGGLNIDYRAQTAEALAETGQQFDIVFNMEVIEHVANPERFMAACNQLVKPDGYEFVATINRNPIAFIIAIFGAENVLRLLPKGTHHYAKLRKPSEITQWLQTDGLSVIESIGVRVNPFKRNMSTMKNQWVNYMLMARKT